MRAQHLFVLTVTIAVLGVTKLAAGPPVTLQAPRAPSVQERLARVRDDVLTRPDRRDASVRELHQLLTLDPALAEAHLLLGLVHAGRGTTDMRAEAAAEFRQALAIEPGFTPARFYLARVYMDLGQLDRAREELITLTETTPKSAQFMAHLAESERRLGNPARAEALTRQALAMEPAQAEARYYLALALSDLGRRDEAIAELEVAAKALAGNADVRLSLGVAYLAAGQTDAAIASLMLGLKLAPPKPEARIHLARAYRLKGLLAQAEAQLDLALPPGASMEASAQYQQIEVDLLVERGLIRLGQKRVPSARQLFEKALAMNPTPESKATIEAALAQTTKATTK